MKSVALLIAALALPVSAQIPANQTTIAGEFNGRFWATLDFNGKLGFVLGFNEGFTSGYSSAEPTPEKEPPLKQGATQEDYKQFFDRIDKNVKARLSKKHEADPVPDGAFGQTVRALDKFYEQPELLPFPVVAAMSVLKVRFAGKP
jgi:hypothetical protein